MVQNRPGYHTLIRSGIMNEGEAEQLARGTSGDRPNPARKNARQPFGSPTAVPVVGEPIAAAIAVPAIATPAVASEG